MQTERTSSLRRVPVRVRRIVGVDGAVNSSPTVLCPALDLSVPLEACSACDRCKRITEDESGAAYVSCQPHSDEAPRSKLPQWLKSAVPLVAEETPVTSITAVDVLCVTADLALESLAALFLERSISAAPVVDEQGFPIGVVSKTDLVRERFECGDDADAAPLPALDANGVQFEAAGFHLVAGRDKTVRDVMMPVAFTLCEHASVAEAAALMAIERVHHVPIVAADNRVVGIVSSLDFARWLARQGEAIT